MPSQKLHRLPGGLYALVDAELVLVCTPATSCGNVDLIGLAFKTRSSGWRLLRRGAVDIGYSPLPELAIERLLADAASLPPCVQAEPFPGFNNARRELAVDADLPHKSALNLLRLAIETIDCLMARQRAPATSPAWPQHEAQDHGFGGLASERPHSAGILDPKNKPPR